MSLDVHVRDQAGTLTVSLVGEIDMDNAWLLADRVTAVLNASHGCAGPTVVIDAAGLTFLGSSGIAALLQLRQRTEQSGGTLIVRSPIGAVRRVLEVVGLLDMFIADQPANTPEAKATALP